MNGYVCTRWKYYSDVATALKNKTEKMKRLFFYNFLLFSSFFPYYFFKTCPLFSSPEPLAQGELLPSASVRRASCVVNNFALNDISSQSDRPRALIFGI